MTKLSNTEVNDLVATSRAMIPEMTDLAKAAPSRGLAAMLGIAIGHALFIRVLADLRDERPEADADVLNEAIVKAYAAMTHTVGRTADAA
jgi:hypothetical protein